MMPKIYKKKVFSVVVAMVFIISVFLTDSVNTDNEANFQNDPLSSFYEQLEIVYSSDSIGRKIIASGDVYVVGSMYNETSGSYDALLSKYNSSGYTQWNESWGGQMNDYGFAIAESETAIHVVGATNSYGSGDSDAFLLTYNASGNLLWNVTYQNNGWDEARGVACLNDSIYVTGFVSTASRSQDIFVLKYNETGSLLWNETYGSVESDVGFDICGFEGEYIYVTGKTGSSGNNDIILLKLDANGTAIWNVTYGGSLSDEGVSVLERDGNVYVGGNTKSYGAGSTDFMLLKYNSSGDFQWETTWGGTDIDRSYDLSIDSKGSLLMVGYTESFAVSGKDACVVKFNRTGDVQWYETRFDLADPADDIAYGSDVNQNDEVYVTGATGNHLFVSKYSQVPGVFYLTNNATAPDDGTFILRWSESLGARNYTLYQSNEPITDINSSVQIVVSETTVMAREFYSLDEGTYYYLAVAHNEYGNTTVVQQAEVEVKRAPGEFWLSHDALDPDPDGKVNLTWTPSTNASSYEVYLNGSLRDQINDTFYLLEWLGNAEYVAQVIAINEVGTNASNEAFFSVLNFPAAFAAYSDAGLPDDDGSFYLTWFRSNFTDHYVIYNSSSYVSEINDTVLVHEVFVPALELPTYRIQVSNLQNGTYYYVVFAFNEYGNFSAECLQVTVLIVPDVDPPDLPDPPLEIPAEVIVQVVIFFVFVALLSILVVVRKKMKR